ncbi:MAG: hypothetical protein JWL90_4104 [Chthoniobacteraceae bacterium]|nr:hypothetical protein [Chthoniobacteraceae bacterium]
MKKHLILLVIAVINFVFLITGNAAPSHPFLDPIRAELNKQLALVPTTTAADRKLIGKLKSALKTIDKPGTSNLGTDVKALNLLINSLGKTTLKDTFTPLLDTAFDKYVAVLATGSADLDVRLDKLVDTKFTANARKQLDQLLKLLDGLAANEDLRAAVKALGKAAGKFTITDTLTSTAEHPPLGANKITATINGAPFTADMRLSLAGYHSTAHFIILTGNVLVGTKVNSLLLTIGNLTEGTSTHTFAGKESETIGAYTKAGIGGGVDSTVVSTGGTVTITLDSAKKVVSGTFSFTANDDANAHPTTVTGGNFVFRYRVE